MPAELKQIRPEIDEDVVKKAEALLERVRAGETTGFLVVEQKRDVVGWTCTALKNRFEVLGYLAYALIQMEKP